MPILSTGRKVVGLTALTLAIGSCFSPKKDPSQFYVLDSVAAAEGGAAGAAGTIGDKAIGVGPVRLPAYLDRPQMITRLSDVQVSVSEYERWAETLESNFVTVLARNLEIELATTRVETFPWVAGVDYSAIVEIRRFERDASGTAELECRWVIIDVDRATVLSRESSYREPADAATTDAAVAALSRTVQRLAADIAAAMLQLPAD